MTEEPEESGDNETTHRHIEQVNDQLSTRVKQLRTERGWSLDAFSAACGVSRSMLSQIERGQANPTLAVALKIAQSFGMSLGDLIQSPGATTLIDVIRQNDRRFHYRSDAECEIRTLSPLHLEKDVEFYEVRFKPNGVLRSAAHFKGTREFLTVQKGKIRVHSADDHADLEVGDSASYRADVPHAIENISRGDAVIFLVDIYQ